MGDLGDIELSASRSAVEIFQKVWTHVLEMRREY